MKATAVEPVTTLEKTIEKTTSLETESIHAELIRAKILQWSGTQGEVRIANKIISAQSAISCVVVPQAEDDVLVCLAGNEAHVLALLNRPVLQNAQITVPGAEQVNLQASTLKLSGSEQIDIDAPKGHFKFGNLSIMGDKILQVATLIMRRAEDLISISNRTTESCEHRVSSVAGIDIRKSQQVHEEVKDTLTMRTKVYLATIKEDVRMVAKRILFS